MEGDPITRIPNFPYQHCGIPVAYRTDGEIIVDPTLIERFVLANSPMKMPHHRMWIYRGALQAFCALYLGETYEPALWDICPNPMQVERFVQVPEEKVRAVRLAQFYENTFRTLKSLDQEALEIPEAVARKWRYLLAQLETTILERHRTTGNYQFAA